MALRNQYMFNAEMATPVRDSKNVRIREESSSLRLVRESIRRIPQSENTRVAPQGRTVIATAALIFDMP